jgi:hypothetical protein
VLAVARFLQFRTAAEPVEFDRVSETRRFWDVADEERFWLAGAIGRAFDVTSFPLCGANGWWRRESAKATIASRRATLF